MPLYTRLFAAISATLALSHTVHANQVAYDLSASTTSIGAAGNSIVLTHQIRNTGTSPLYGVRVKLNNTGSDVCYIGSLWNGVSTSCTSYYRVTNSDVSSGSINFTGQVSANGESVTQDTFAVGQSAGTSTGGSSSSGSSTSSSTTSSSTTGGNVGLSVETNLNKGGDGVASVGDRVAITYTVKNNSQTLQQNVKVQANSISYTCNVGSLYSGVTTSCSGSYFLKSADISAGNVSFDAAVSSNQSGSQNHPVNLSLGSGSTSSSTSTTGSDNSGTTSTTTDTASSAGDIGIAVTATVNKGSDGVVNAGDQAVLGVSLTNSTGITSISNVSAVANDLGYRCNAGSLYKNITANCGGSYTLKASDISLGRLIVKLTVDSNQTVAKTTTKSFSLATAGASTSSSGGSTQTGSSGGSTTDGSSSTGSGTTTTGGSSSGGTTTTNGGSAGSMTRGSNNGGLALGGWVADGPSSVSQCAQSSATGQNRVVVNAGSNLAQLVANASAGTEFLIKQGTHYSSRITPKHNMRFICETGAVINGAKLLTGAWYNSNGYWFLDGAPWAQWGYGAMRPQNNVNKVINDLFVNDQLLMRVDSLSKVNNTPVYFDGEMIYAGTFYQDGQRLYTKLNPNGKKVEFSVHEWAFYSPKGYGDNVVIENCTVEKYASGDIAGAIVAKETKNWTLRNVNARFNHTGGLQVGSNTKVFCGEYNKNGQIGITGSYYEDEYTGEVYSYADNALITGVEVAYNNWAGYDSEWHASGMKFFTTNNLTVTHSHVHHNYGVGVWLDWDGHDSIINNNYIHDNASRGVLLEGVNRGEVKDNVVTCNAKMADYNLDYSWFWGAQIYLKNSSNYSIANNEIQHRYGQPWALVDNQDRGWAPSWGQRKAVNVQVHNNRITMADVPPPSSDSNNYFHQRVGIESDWGAKNVGMDVTRAASNNSVYSNEYRMANTNGKHWRVDGVTYSSGNVPTSWENGSTYTQMSGLANLCN